MNLRNSVQDMHKKAHKRHMPVLRKQFEEHDAQRNVDEQHQEYQLLPREPVLCRTIFYNHYNILLYFFCTVKEELKISRGNSPACVLLFQPSLNNSILRYSSHLYVS